VGFFQHGVGLADARGGAEEGPELSACHAGAASFLPLLAVRVERDVELEDVDGGLAEETEHPAVGVILHECVDVGFGHPSFAGDPRRLKISVGGADVRVETAAAGVTASAGTTWSAGASPRIGVITAPRAR
jgi:hypothetical protein